MYNVYYTSVHKPVYKNTRKQVEYLVDLTLT